MSVTETPGKRAFVLPADYYSTPTPEAVLPRWATFGCGGAAALALVIIFAGGAFLASGGFTDLMDMVFGMSMGELRGMYAPDVTEAQKKELETEVSAMRKNLRENRISVQSLDPLLQAMRRATSDEKVDAAETRELVSATRKVNATQKK